MARLKTVFRSFEWSGDDRFLVYWDLDQVIPDLQTFHDSPRG